MSRTSVRLLVVLVSVAATSSVAIAGGSCFPLLAGSSYDCRFADAHNVFHDQSVCMVFDNSLAMGAEYFGGDFRCDCLPSGTAKQPSFAGTRRFICVGISAGAPSAFQGRVSKKGISDATVNVSGFLYSAVFDCKPRTDPAPCPVPTPRPSIAPSPAPSPTPTP